MPTLKDLKPDDNCEVKIGDTWHPARFISFYGVMQDKEGKPWDKFAAFVPGFNGHRAGVLGGLKGGYNIRLPEGTA